MISIKIECICGQHYTFEIEPVNGRMPSPVACPVCGTDGTAAANDFIAQSLAVLAPAPQDLTAATSRGSPAQTPQRSAPGLHVAPTPSAAGARPGPRSGALLPGQPAHTQAIFEARAKISWGDPPKEVLKYLMIQGFSYPEASELVNEMFQERAAAVRSNGIKYVIFGGIMICMPVMAFFTFRRFGVLLIRSFLVTVVIGLVGLWMLIKGIFMVVAPKSESGDVAEQ